MPSYFLSGPFQEWDQSPKLMCPLGTGRTVGSQASSSFKFSVSAPNLSFSFFFLPEKSASHLGYRKNSIWLSIASQFFYTWTKPLTRVIMDEMVGWHHQLNELEFE